jgi:hypothetical protein
MFIRHGEKPADAPPPHGVTIHGKTDPEALTPRGWQRAGALVSFFDPPTKQYSHPNIATPQTIYAAEVGPHSECLRHQQTVTPLLEKLGDRAKPNFYFPKDRAHDVIASVLDNEGIILICWDHEEFPKMIERIPISPNNVTPVPAAWDHHRFDLVWIFDFEPSTNAYRFTVAPQLLLSGDAPP